MATHNISLFFYIKGSKDFPSGHGIDEKFGFERAIASTFDEDKESGLKTGYLHVNSETAIFDASIRDIYLRNKGAREITNTYSLVSDKDNCIFNYTRNNPSLGVNNRTERSLEYLSSIIVKPAYDKDGIYDYNENEIYKQIYPNYTYTSKGELDRLLNMSSNDNLDYPPRQSIFWQKMFTLLEYLKKYEKDIISDDITGSFPKDYNRAWWTGNPGDNNYNENGYIGIERLLQNETSLGRYIGLFIGAKSEQEGGESFHVTTNNFVLHTTETIDGGTPVDVAYDTNPIRNKELAGSETGYPSSEVDSMTGVPNIHVLQEKLWEDLHISYIPGSAYSEASVHDGRIKKLFFSVKYKQYGNTQAKNYDVWNFTVYFDPDAFIADSTSNRFGVWTYNDMDLDDEYRDAKEPGFNIYDNDYANLLREDTIKYGHFMATEAEVQNAMAKAMLDEMKGNDFTNFVAVDVIRVSPELVEHGRTSTNKPIFEVNWPSINGNENPKAHGVGKQTFYVFYNTVPPSANQAREAIRNYILKLHSKCHEQTNYSEDEEFAGVKYIGHPRNDTELRNWLSHMYPDLFSETIIYIIPPLDTHRNDLAESAAWDVSKYFHTETQKRIYESMRYVNNFKNFQFEANGNVSIPTNSGDIRKYFGTEVFYLGGLNNDQNNSAFNFPAPFIAAMTSETLDTPLTSQTGFTGYVPKFFDHNASPTTPADILQFILIKLMNQMFINDNNEKTKLTPIAGVNISYSMDIDTDETVMADERHPVNNVATFTINGVNFIVYAQRKKNFCSVNGQEVAV